MAEFVPRFDWLKTKYQNYLREDYYFDILLQTDIDMFTYENLPKSLDPVWIEKYLTVGGSIGLQKKDDGYIVAPVPARCGELNQYGDGMSLAGATNNGSPLQGTLGKDCVIIYNRSSRMPELDNMIDAASLMEIDKSAGINVRFSRVAPLYNCTNDTTRKALDTILNDVLEGKLKTIVSDNLTDNLMPESGTQLLDVTEPEKIQYIQYLTQYYDAVLRRHYNRRGLQIRTGTKAAQQSQSEIFGFDAISWVLPLARLKARQDGWKKFNELFNENVQVRFSDLWMQEYEAYLLRTLQRDEQKEGAVNAGAGNPGNVGDDTGNPGNDSSAAGSADEADGQPG